MRWTKAILHIMYMEMEKCYQQFNKKLTHNLDQDSPSFPVRFINWVVVNPRQKRWSEVKGLVLVREPFQPQSLRRQSEPDVKRTVCRHSRMAETAQSIGFKLVRSVYSVVSNTNRRTASANQWAPAVWTEMKERLEVTRGGNSRVAASLNTSAFPLSVLAVACCVATSMFNFKTDGPTAWGSNSPQSYGRNCSCISALSGPLVIRSWELCAGNEKK